eukprot:Nk52_evm2s539 gene=Nk52_evmTU2s539
MSVSRVTRVSTKPSKASVDPSGVPAQAKSTKSSKTSVDPSGVPAQAKSTKSSKTSVDPSEAERAALKAKYKRIIAQREKEYPKTEHVSINPEDTLRKLAALREQKKLPRDPFGDWEKLNGSSICKQMMVLINLRFSNIERFIPSLTITLPLVNLFKTFCVENKRDLLTEVCPAEGVRQSVALIYESLLESENSWLQRDVCTFIASSLMHKTSLCLSYTVTEILGAQGGDLSECLGLAISRAKEDLKKFVADRGALPLCIYLKMIHEQHYTVYKWRLDEDNANVYDSLYSEERERKNALLYERKVSKVFKALFDAIQNQWKETGDAGEVKATEKKIIHACKDALQGDGSSCGIATILYIVYDSHAEGTREECRNETVFSAIKPDSWYTHWAHPQFRSYIRSAMAIVLMQDSSSYSSVLQHKYSHSPIATKRKSPSSPANRNKIPKVAHMQSPTTRKQRKALLEFWKAELGNKSTKEGRDLAIRVLASLLGDSEGIKRVKLLCHQDHKHLPSKFISDELLTPYFVRYLANKASSYHHFYFVTRDFLNGTLKEGKAMDGFIKSWKEDDGAILMFPFSRPGSMHWVLCVLLKRKKSFQVYDSFGMSDEEAKNTFLETNVGSRLFSMIPSRRLVFSNV